jgi:eukaryotic-like serine/threonine-protein kinase
MTEKPLRACGTVSMELEHHHGAICEEFDRAWRDGKKPRIEDWLDKVPDDERPALFGLLARREKAFRPNESLVDEFSSRFPSMTGLIGPLLQDSTDFTVDAERHEPLPAIPGYRMLERIAFGGMGVIYKAVHVGLDRVVALKMVRGGSAIKDGEIARFRIEAQAIAGIKHPHIVDIHDFGTFQGLPFFTMEYLEGGSLSQKLYIETINFRDSAALIETLARTMQVVHDRKLVHRDLKPGNILLAKDGTPKISDFGLAKRLGVDQNMTVSGLVMGTACYMAPEQARGERTITPAVDIYALGAILYECLTGRLLFRDESYEKTIRRVTDEEPVRPREILALIPPELEAVCLKCLEKNPARRYAKAADLADDLRRFLNGEPLSIGTFDVIDQHERWAAKVGLEELDLLGCTPWAFVYRARQKIINRKVLLKISTGMAGSPSHARLIRQAEAMAGLNHPNVEQIHSYAEAGGQPYLVQEFVEGRSLSSLMRERSRDPDESDLGQIGDPSAEISINRLPPRGIFTPLTSQLAAEWATILARALQFVHEQRVLHGAIYPGEIRLTTADTLKLGGFGAAQKLSPGQAPQETSAGWVRPNYQPPEQINGDWQSLGFASDIYSLGAVFYEMLTGQLPYFGLGIQETRVAVRQDVPLAPRNINPRIPSFLDWICQRCLAKKPEDRFASAAEVADALERFLQSKDLAREETAYITSDSAGVPALSDFALSVFVKGQPKPAVFPLPRRWITIGRAIESDIVIQDDYCSRQHCAIYWDDRSNQHILVLIKARHGVKIDGESVRGSQALIPGDVIQIVSTQMVFDRKSNS